MDPSRIGLGAPATAGPLPFIAVQVHLASEGQWHAALVYWSEERRAYFQIELAFHNDLRHWECPFKKGVWVRVAATSLGARAALANLVAMCRVVGDRYAVRRAGIPYGSVYAGGVFALGDGSYLRDVSRESGLTCATFILALFETVEWPLVDRETWPEDPARCVAWRAHVVDLLESRGHYGQAECVRRDDSCVRFLPTEVAGACLWAPPGVAFPAASAGAAEVERAAAGT